MLEPFHSNVRFLLFGSHEMAPSTYQAWVVSHFVLAGLALILLAIVARAIVTRASLATPSTASLPSPADQE